MAAKQLLRDPIGERAALAFVYIGSDHAGFDLKSYLVAALTKAKTPEQAMEDTEAGWKKIVRRTGQDKIVEAIKTNKAAFQDVVYGPTGFFLGYQAWRKNVSGIVKAPFPVFWDVKKA